MILYIDKESAKKLSYMTQSGGRFYYCAKSPDMAIVRVDVGDIFAVTDLIVDAQIGWDNGAPGFVRDRNQGLLHTKITIRRLLGNAGYSRTLGDVLKNSPKESQ